MEQEWSEFWWENITGANMAVNAVVNSLTGNITTLIDLPVNLPWRKEMRNVIQKRLDAQALGKIIDMIDDAEECHEDPGKYLLREYAQDDEIRNGYRSFPGRTIQDYLIKKSVLNGTIIWVKGLSPIRAQKWIQFCEKFNPNITDKAMFILEVHAPPKLDPALMHVVPLMHYLTNYDVQVFSSFILYNKKNLSIEWKRYISSVIASLCHTDAEIAEQLLQADNLKDVSFLDKVRKLADDAQYSKRGRDENSSHIFSSCRNENSDELEHRLWTAQIQVLFPVIELERMHFVQEFDKQLKHALRTHRLEQYNKPVTEPATVELGAFCYMMNSGWITLENRIAARIEFLHACRNQLAHAHCCDVAHVKKLLDNHEEYLNYFCTDYDYHY